VLPGPTPPQGARLGRAGAGVPAVQSPDATVLSPCSPGPTLPPAPGGPACKEGMVCMQAADACS
jgi:hypothetical protein